MSSALIEELTRKSFDIIDCFLPCTATIRGVHRYDDMLEDWSSRSCTSTGEALSALAMQLTAIPLHNLPVSSLTELILTTECIAETLHLLTFERPWDYDPLIYLLPFGSALHYMRERDYSPLKERLEAMASRLERYPQFLREARERLKPASSFHIRSAIPVAFGVKLYIQELITWIGSKAPEYSSLITNGATKSIEALLSFREYLMNSLLPEADRRRPSYYASLHQKVRKESLTLYSLEHLWELADTGLNTALNELKAHASALSGKENWSALIEKFRRIHPSIDTLEESYMQALHSSQRFTEANITDIPSGPPVRLIDTPMFFRIKYPTVSFAAAGGLENVQQTFLCLTPIVTGFSEIEELNQLAEHCRGRIDFTSIHEVFPGHHLHLLYAASHPQQIVRRYRSLMTCEGWAFYCEELAQHKGYLTPEGILFSLEAKAWRFARMWIEVGFHSGKISYIDACRTIREKLHATQEIAEAEALRCIINPGEASSYCLGKLEFDSMKQEYLRKNPTFNEKHFHEAFLKAGAVPIRLLSIVLGLRDERESSSIMASLKALIMTTCRHRNSRSLLTASS